MKSEALKFKINKAYQEVDDAFVQAANDLHVLIHDKQTLAAARALDKCIKILDKVKAQK